MARPAQEILDGPNLAALTEALEQGVRRERPVTMLHLVTRVEMRVEGLMVQMGAVASPRMGAERELGNVLSRFADTLRVVVLSLTGPPGTDTSGLARELHRAGVAAVVSPRLPLSQDSVVPFVTHLYDALIAQALPLNKALTSTYSRMRSDGLRLDAASHQIFRSPSVSAAIRPFTFAPYKGLAPYRPIDSTRFFGRFAETLKLVDLVSSLTKQGRPRFVLVAGAPHSGRTSLVEAGLYPALRNKVPGLELCRIDPSVDPLSQVDTALAAPRKDGASVLMVVDSLDHLLSSNDSIATARRLVNRLWRLAASGTSRVTVVVVLRVDQLAACGRIVVDDLGASLENLAYDDRHRLFITEPGPRALREIIDRPAQMVDLAMDAEFATSVMRAAARRPGSLREVSLVLDRAWSSAQRHHPQHRALRDRLPSGAFSRLTILACSSRDRLAFIGILVRGLVDSTQGTHTRTRPTAAFSAWRAQSVRASRAGMVELGRSAMLLVLSVACVSSARVGVVWPSGDRLPLRLRCLLRCVPVPGPAATRCGMGRGPSSVSASGAGLFGWWGSESHQRNQADERFEAAERAVGDPTSAAVLLRQIPPMLRPEGWAAAANAALQSAQADKVLHYDGANVQQLAFSSDGSMLLVRVDGEIKLVSTTEGNVPTREIKLDDADGGVVAATFSPSGVKVVTVARSGRVQAWPVAGGVPQDIAPAVEQDAGVVAAFSPRARHLVRVWGTSVQVHDIDGNAIKTSRLSTSRADGASTACCAVVDDAGERWAVGTEEGQILLFERNRKRAKKLRLEGLRRFHLNRGGTHLLALGDGTLRIIDMMRGTGSNRTPASVRVDAAVFSPDGRHIAVDYLDQNTGVRHSRSVSVASRREQLESPELVGRATALGASPGGDVLLRAADGVIGELDIETGVQITEYRGHGSPIREIRQSEDGVWLASSAIDGSVRIWRRAKDRPSLVSHPPRELGVDPLVFTPDGGVGGVTHEGRLSAALILMRSWWISARPGPMQLLWWPTTAPDSSRSMRVRCSREGREGGSWSRAPVQSLRFLPVSTQCAGWSAGCSPPCARPRRPRSEPLPMPSDNVRAFDPDGRFPALGFQDGVVRLFDAASSVSLELDSGDGRITAVCVSASGRNAVLGTAEGTLTL